MVPGVAVKKLCSNTMISLSFGVDADSFSEESSSSSATALKNSTSSNDGSLVEDLSNVYTDSVIDEQPIKQSSSAKRKSEENQVPRLTDNKRKHLEKTLPAAQRDQQLLQEAKDDTHCKSQIDFWLNHCMEFFS